MCFTTVPHLRRLCRRLPFWRGSGTTFGLGNASAHKAASCWRSVAPKVLHNALRDGPRCPKGLQKLAFRPPWATLLEQIGERVVFAKDILFNMFSSHGATPVRSTVALLTALDTECVPEPAFCVPWRPPVRPSVAAGRHREPNVTPNGVKKRPGDHQKSMTNPCCGLRGALGALGVSRGTPLAPKMLQNTVFPTLAKHLKEPCAHVVQQERVRNKLRWFCPPRTCFQKAGAGFVLHERLQKKLVVVSSLQTVFQKMPLAPTFLSSSTTRRHNNARPPPVHTLLSAAAERSSYG